MHDGSRACDWRRGCTLSRNADRARPVLAVTTVSVGIATTKSDGHHAAGASLGAMYMHTSDSQFGSTDAFGLQLSAIETVHPMEMLWSLYKHPPGGPG